MKEHDAIILEGTLVRITYENPSSRFAVARFHPSGLKQPITITGHLGGTHPGQELRIRGEWEAHPRFGDQFRVYHHEITPPSSPEGIRRLLASGAIAGVGPQLAGRLVAAFGTETLTVIAEQPQRLAQIEGIGAAKAGLIHAAWREHASWIGLLQELGRLGVSSSIAAPLFGLFGDDAIRLVREDPYRLVTEMPEIGFDAVDRIARQSDRPIDRLKRGFAGVRHLFHHQAADGHTAVDEAVFYENCDSRYGIDFETARDCLEQMVKNGEVYTENAAEGRFVSPARLFIAENGIARRLSAMMALPFEPLKPDGPKLFETVQQSLSITLSDNQLSTLERLMGHRVAVISGGPGTGKTTLIRSICCVFEHFAKSVVLAAPTGRAARRLSQVTGREARTLHRLLEYQPGPDVFLRDRDRPLPVQAVVIDEVSMVDVELMHALLEAVPLHAMLILVGDAGQLPSVGPGNVLADLIRSEKIPVYYLTDMFRQEQGGLIAVNAHRVRRGKMPLEGAENSVAAKEYVYLEREHSKQVLDEILAWCRFKIPERFGLDPIGDIQVLTPMHKGIAGTVNLNQVLQQVLNPDAEEVSLAGRHFRLGDKVMHLVNNYQKEVFNGDIGVVREIDSGKKALTVSYEGRRVRYEAAEVHELSSAYAISIHKSQGSEYPAVIIPLVTQHYALLQRNVLYTALTRARQLVVIIGSRRALGMAVARDQPSQRLTWLAHRLRESVG